MAIILNDNIKVNAGKPIDTKYLNFNNLPYSSTTTVLAAIPESQRYVGLTVNVNNVEYWFYNGVGDNDLVIKDSGIANDGLFYAENGLSKINNCVVLGGILNNNTSILGNNSNLFLGSSDCRLSYFYAYANGNITFDSFNTFNVNTLCGNITTTNGRGLVYSNDYSSTFIDESLVSKRYVDSLASGINPKNAVLVVSTSDIVELQGLKTIDGVTLSAGDRVLLVGQTGGTENGIYVVSTGVWQRSADFDGTPNGEITQGALIPVLSGDTNKNTSWILITKNPININVTPLTFTLFSKLIDVSSGQGISVNSVGGNKQINVNIANNSGLEFLAGKLSVNSGIAGDGLTWNNGILYVNAVCIDNNVDIPVKFDNSYNLMVNSQDIISSGNFITGATNGLSKINNCVVLGGILNNNTSILGNNSNLFLGSSDCRLSYFYAYANGNITFDSFNTFNVNTLCGNITTTNGRGLVYSNDYSSTFIDESLVSKRYVDNKVETSTVIAVNGLTKLNNEIKLGGCLCENTTIDGYSNSIIFDHYDIFSIAANCINISSGVHSLLSGNTNSILIASSPTSITIPENTYTNKIILSNLVIWEEPENGSVNDYVLSWNDTDKNVKKISGDLLGDKNNIYNYLEVSGSTTLTENSPYVIFVNSTTPVTITLPLSPLNGQVLKIKDISGNALSNNITINGNGRNIDGSLNVVINTDYGAFELIYNNSNWFSLAFVN